jgi:hypothetical protein
VHGPFQVPDPVGVAEGLRDMAVGQSPAGLVEKEQSDDEEEFT